MSKYVIHNGGNVTFVNADRIVNKLDVGFYNVEKSMSGYYLVNRAPFELPSKIYGKTSFPERVLEAFKRRGQGFGVLLSGAKGAGKTVEAKQICVQSNMPVIILNNGIDSDFTSFLEGIETPCIVFIDEFEKTFSTAERNTLLSILDGTSTKRHIFILTSNESNIGQFFMSRPGRVRYHKKYDHLSDEIIEEIIEDKLENKEFADAVRRTVDRAQEITMDGLTSLIEEVNIFNEPPKNFMEFFNLSPSRPKNFNVTLETYVYSLNPAYREQLVGEGKPFSSDDQVNYVLNKLNNGNFDKPIDWFEGGGEEGDEERILSMLEKNKKIFTASYVNPFNYDSENEEDGKFPHVIIHNLTGSNYKDTRDFYCAPSKVEKFISNRRGFVLVTKDGEILRGTPQKQFVKSWI